MSAFKDSFFPSYPHECVRIIFFSSMYAHCTHHLIAPTDFSRGLFLDFLGIN